MVFQDGQAFKDQNGDMRTQNVLDNLIYRREIPVMIAVFINPGRTPEQAGAESGNRLGRRVSPIAASSTTRRTISTLA